MAQNIEPRKEGSSVPETPFNTPQVASALSRGDALPVPAVATVTEDDEEEEEGGNPASMLANNPALLSMVQGKLDTLIGRPSGYISSLPPAVKRRIEGLKGIQQEHAKIENEFQLEILELEKKFAARYAPLYSRRSDIITGKAEPTEEEVAAGEAADSDDEEEEEEEEARVTELDESAKNADDIKGIPQFWLTALKNHAIIGDQITEKDEEALKHLIDIRLEYLDTKQAGFKLLFVFEENEFFEDTVLEKTYYYQEEVGYGGDFVYDKAVGHEIKWKADKDLTKKVEIKKQRNKNTKQVRVVKKVVPTDSFFNFFKPPQPPSVEALEEGDVEEEELEALDEKLEIDYQIGEDLKERIIPRAIDYFTGKALDYEEDDDEFDEDGDFSDDDDDEDDDDEDDARRKVPAPSTSQQGAEECKQQ